MLPDGTEGRWRRKLGHDGARLAAGSGGDLSDCQPCAHDPLYSRGHRDMKDLRDEGGLRKDDRGCTWPGGRRPVAKEVAQAKAANSDQAEG